MRAHTIDAGIAACTALTQVPAILDLTDSAGIMRTLLVWSLMYLPVFGA